MRAWMRWLWWGDVRPRGAWWYLIGRDGSRRPVVFVEDRRAG